MISIDNIHVYIYIHVYHAHVCPSLVESLTPVISPINLPRYTMIHFPTTHTRTV